MTYKQYQTVRAVLAAVIAGVISYSVVTQNLILAAVAVVLGITFALVARRRVKELVADERDYTNAGRAARYAISIFAPVTALLALALMFTHSISPTYQTVGSTLAYSVCALMLLHAAFYSYLNKRT